MGHHDNCGPFLFVQMRERIHHPGNAGRIQTSGRLVGEQHRRSIGQCSSNGDTLTLASGQLGWLSRRLVNHIDGCEKLQGTQSALLPTEVSAIHHDLHVAHSIKMGKEIVQLEHKTDLISPVVGKVHGIEKIVSVEGHGTPSRSIQGGKELEKR